MTSTTIQSLLAEIIRAGAAPGAAIWLSTPDQQIFAASGTASHGGDAALTQASRFQLGCITKLLTALVSLELAHEAALDVEAPIRRYLHELAGTEVGEAVRVRHLLSHTAGYQGFNIADPRIRFLSSWPKFIAAMRERRLLFTPGQVFNYEHTEYVLLGEILQRIAGAHIHELYRTKVFDPVGIQCGHIASDAADSARFVPEHSFDAQSRSYATLRLPPQCAFWDASLSDLTMSLGDLGLLTGAAAGWDRHHVFSASTVAQLRAMQVSLPAAHGGSQSEQMPLAFGLGLAGYADSLLGHNGSARGHTCALRFDPQSRLILVVALNVWRPHARDLLVAKISSAHRPRNSAVCAGMTAGEIAAAPGVYVGADGTSVDVTGHEGELCCVLRAGPMNPELRVTISCRDQGISEVKSSAAHATVGFFRVPGTEAVGLMLGLNAYRRLDSAEPLQ
jgi:CubicO group peptidase (beta-lactamase class C family)